MLKVKKLVVMALMLTVTMVSIYGQAMAIGSKININTAPVAELVQLEKVNEVFAQLIVEYREKNGPFTMPSDISKVVGIDAQTYEINKDVIVVAGEEPVTPAAD